VALDATVGGANANSYQTVAGADTYYTEHLYASGWNVATSAQKAAALIAATRGLDGMPAAWNGNASTSVQALGFPRTGLLTRNGFPLSSTIVPNELKNATSEYAGILLRSDPSAAGEAIAMGLTSIKIEGLTLGFKEDESSAGETPSYLQDPSRTSGKDAMVPASVLILLVPSWLIDKRDLDAPYSGIVAEVL